MLGHGPGSAVLTVNGRIAAVGQTGDVEALAPPGTERIDLAGGILTPGFQDAHIHPAMGGLQRLRCDLEPAEELEDALTVISEHASSSTGWLLGGGWRYRWFPGGNPPAALLDRITDRPVWLVVADGHSGWANHTTLEMAGIDSTTPDPADGVIVRLADGSPQGTLHEGAMDLVERVLPPDEPGEIRAALLESQAYLLSLGITAWQDAWVTPDLHEAYLELARSGDLQCRVRGALWWDRNRGLEQLAEIVERARQTETNYVPRTVKLMLDGVCENFTASMLEPYLDHDGHPTDHHGIDFIDPGELPSIVAAIDAAGLQCHFHALGDAAVRHALDAIEHAQRVNGVRDSRHHLAHIQLVDPADIGRFARLGAIANMQPLWANADEAMTELTIPFLPPERVDLQYPFRSLLQSGTRLAMGSDWSVSTPDVLQQIAVAATRARPDRGVHEPFIPSERLPIGEALTAATEGSAWVNFFDRDSGRIKKGLRADLAVISGNPTHENPIDLAVTTTVLDGTVVHRV